MYMVKKVKNNNMIKDIDNSNKNTHFIIAILFPILCMIGGSIITIATYLCINIVAGLITLGKPMGFIRWFNNSPLTLIINGASIIIVVFMWVKLFEGRNLYTIGFYKFKFIKKYLIGFCVGAVLISLSILIIVITCDVKIQYTDFYNIPVITFMLVIMAWIIQGASEEILLRGFVLPNISKKFNVVYGVVINSFIFALLHLLNSGMTLLAFFNLFLFGVFASIYVLYNDDIWGICGMHAAWNLFQSNIFGLLVSGENNTWPKLLSIECTSDTLINVGDFGLEGEISVTIVLLIGLIILSVLLNKKNIEVR